MACQGGYVCENNGGCLGAVRRVTVSGGVTSPMDFWYCETAIAEDIKRGFTVEDETGVITAAKNVEG